MSMTREEAILLSAYTGFLFAPDFSEVHKFCEDTLGRPIWTHEFADNCVQKEIQEKLRPQIMELVQNIATLRPVSREQVEKVWSPCNFCAGAKYITGAVTAVYPVSETHQQETLAEGDFDFCPVCGRPLTDEAVDMVMGRLGGLYENRD